MHINNYTHAYYSYVHIRLSVYLSFQYELKIEYSATLIICTSTIGNVNYLNSQMTVLLEYIDLYIFNHN